MLEKKGDTSIAITSLTIPCSLHEKVWADKQ